MQKLSLRLKTCASLVKQGSRLADVGCDHGYVPVYLCENGIIKSAVACDINAGPLNSCKSLVKMRKMENQIKCVLSDGLKEIDENDVDDILIAGVGGELISSILTACPYVRKKHIILNPMTHPELARKWLYENGFTILNDIVVSDGDHNYSVFDAVYTGEYNAYSVTDCFIGNINDFSNREYFAHLLNYLKNKEKGGEDYSAVINEINVRLNNDNC